MNIKKYKTGEITQILEGVYNDPITRRTVVPLFQSDPGRGKTHIIRDFMKSKGCNHPAFVLSQRMPFEVSGMALVDREKEFMKYYDFDFFMNLKDGDILFCDEAFNANPLTLSAFLTFLEDRIMISGKKLPNIMIVAAANPQGKPILTPQINRRFLIYDIIFDAPYWKNFMLNKYKMPDIVSSKLCNLIKNEDFTGYNYCTEADFDKATYMIINNISTPYEDTLKPILNTLIKNELKEPVTLSEDRVLEIGETIPWLAMIRINKNCVIPETTKKELYQYYSVHLIEPSDKKLNLVKSIKEATGLGLKESKDLVDNAPSQIETNLDEYAAKKLKRKLEESGSIVEVRGVFSREKFKSNNYEIEMFDKDKNKIGEIKDIETLKRMYYLSDKDIERIENGELTSPASPRGFSPSFFQKKIIK